MSGGNVVGIPKGRYRQPIERSRVEWLSRTHMEACIDRGHEVLARVMVVIGVDTVE